jgi:SAM-dependent methyltransferase
VWQLSDWGFAGRTAFAGGWPFSTDPRHVRWLYEMMLVAGCQSVLEIGCWDGFTTSAFVQALNEGAEFELCCVDISIRPGLRDVAGRARRAVELVQADSLDLLARRRFDLVLVDGNHSIGQVSRELGHLLAAECPTVVAHDVGDVAPTFGGDGSLWLGKVLQAHPSYLCRVDQVKRLGEYTERGLLLATRDGGLFARSAAAWSRMLDLPAPGN